MKYMSSCIVVALAAVLGQPAAFAFPAAQPVNTGPVEASSLPDAPSPRSVPPETEAASGVSTNSSDASSSENANGDRTSWTPGVISGTVTDVYGDVVPGVTVKLEGPQGRDHREVVANDNAAFQFSDLKPGVPYQVTIDVKGFARWTSSPVTLAPGQNELLSGIQLKIEGERTSVLVSADPVQIATEQVNIEMQQRVLGFIPNFYVVYDSKNAVPLTPKLKYKLAMRVSGDPITIGGVLFMAGINQTANTPNYVLGAKGYGQRIGATAAYGISDILLGGAVFPSLLHQDPRYFYQGSGSNSSRFRHAIFSPFLCRGDNGQRQINYSSLLGDLGASSLANAYYPDSNRGVGLVFGSFAIGTMERMVSGLAQEFILPRFTPAAKKQLAKEAYSIPQ